MVFVIHWHESAMDLHVFPIPIPSPAFLSIPSLWVFPVHQARALVSCIQPGLLICFTLDNIPILIRYGYFLKIVHYQNVQASWHKCFLVSFPHPLNADNKKVLFLHSWCWIFVLSLSFSLPLTRVTLFVCVYVNNWMDFFPICSHFHRFYFSVICLQVDYIHCLGTWISAVKHGQWFPPEPTILRVWWSGWPSPAQCCQEN